MSRPSAEECLTDVEALSSVPVRTEMAMVAAEKTKPHMMVVVFRFR